MDKKLSDNEIVKALDNDCLCVVYGVDCESCPLREKDCKILPEAIKDLIHRLQSENKELKSPKFASWKLKFFRLKEEFDKELAEHEEFAKKANAEIERLTEELDLANETIDRNNKRYERVSIERQKALDRVDYLEDALLDKIRRNEELITAIKQAEQQAVKDTAKEILGVILAKEFEKGDYLTDDELHEIFKERYGVSYEENN